MSDQPRLVIFGFFWAFPSTEGVKGTMREVRRRYIDKEGRSVEVGVQLASTSVMVCQRQVSRLEVAIIPTALVTAVNVFVPVVLLVFVALRFLGYVLVLVS